MLHTTVLRQPGVGAVLAILSPILRTDDSIYGPRVMVQVVLVSIQGATLQHEGSDS